jgi:hypothetical protein
MELFDLANDPGEKHDVASANADVVDHLKAKYDLIAADFPESAKDAKVKRKQTKRQRDQKSAR